MPRVLRRFFKKIVLGQSARKAKKHLITTCLKEKFWLSNDCSRSEINELYFDRGSAIEQVVMADLLHCLILMFQGVNVWSRLNIITIYFVFGVTE